MLLARDAGQPHLAVPFQYRTCRYIPEHGLYRIAPHASRVCSSSWLMSWSDKRWSRQSVHRLILTSSVYRHPARPDPSQGRRIDHDNHLLGSVSNSRLDAEAIRDAMLPPSPESSIFVRVGLMYQPIVPIRRGCHRRVRRRSDPTFGLPPARRTEIPSLLEVFDAPSIVTTCTRRVSSTIPLQSLSLMNSDFMIVRA